VGWIHKKSQFLDWKPPVRVTVWTTTVKPGADAMAKQFGVCCNGPRISRSNLRKLILIGTQSNTQRTSMDKILVHFYAKMVSTPTARATQNQHNMEMCGYAVGLREIAGQRTNRLSLTSKREIKRRRRRWSRPLRSRLASLEGVQCISAADWTRAVHLQRQKSTQTFNIHHSKQQLAQHWHRAFCTSLSESRCIYTVTGKKRPP